MMTTDQCTMRNINIVFETEEHEQLSELKGKQSWREYILKLAGIDMKKEETT